MNGKLWIRKKLEENNMDYVSVKDMYQEYTMDINSECSETTYRDNVKRIYNDLLMYDSEDSGDGLDEETNDTYIESAETISEDGSAKIKESKPGINRKNIESDGTEIKTLEELIDSCKIDTKVWKVDKYTQRSTIKAGKQTFFVSANLIKIIPDETICPPIQPISLTIPEVKFTETSKTEMRTAVVLSDIHFGFSKNHDTGELIPFHDDRALNIALKVINDVKPDVVILAGDNLDMADWSDHFSKSPEVYFTLQPTLIEASKWFGKLRQVTDKEIIYIVGNHDGSRLERFVEKNMAFAYNLKDISGNSVLSLQSLIDFKNLNMNYLDGYPNNSYWLGENLEVVHGTFAKTGAGETGKEYLKTARHSMIIGHSHRAEIVHKTVRAMRGNITYTVANGGCMCKIDGTVPGSKNTTDWQNGFLVVHYEEGNGRFQITPVSVNGNKAIYSGKLYTGDIVETKEQILADVEARR